MEKNKVVTFGEIMLRLNSPGFQRLKQASHFEVNYGGGEANVAASLAQFGLTAKFITRLPKNDLGQTCISRLLALGVDTSQIIWGGDRLGIYFLEMGVAQRPSKVLYDRAGSSFSTLQPGMINWSEIFRDANWFHWTGISPAVSSSAADTCREALEAAENEGLTISCDLNYRGKLWQWTNSPGVVMNELVKKCNIIICNEEDAAKYFGINAAGSDVEAGTINGETYLPVCKKIGNMFQKASKIAITLRGSISASHNTWSAVMYAKDRYYQGQTYDVSPIVDRVGGGDSFAAGLIYSLINNPENIQKALDFAIAASCLKHTIPGDINFSSLQEVEQLVGGNQSGRITR